MTADRRPDWLHVGAEVGVYQTGSHTLYGSGAKRLTIAKVGKRDVVLSDGQRFNIDRLRKSSGTWSPTTYLTSVDDAAFLRAEDDDRCRRLDSGIERLIKEWREGKYVGVVPLRIIVAKIGQHIGDGA